MRGRPTAHHEQEGRGFANPSPSFDAYRVVHHPWPAWPWSDNRDKRHHHANSGGKMRKGIKKSRLVWGAIGAVLLGAFALIPLGTAFPMFH